jgi:hypothetical protein
MMRRYWRLLVLVVGSTMISVGFIVAIVAPNGAPGIGSLIIGFLLCGLVVGDVAVDEASYRTTQGRRLSERDDV